MNTYPLIRNRWSNEHLLTVLFAAVSLYQLPDWIAAPLDIIRYALIIIAALVLDAAINFIRYKKPVCAVSSAVTAAVLYPVIKGLPGWAGLLGIAAALIVGKHIWGGTGKNIFNPAVTGMFIVSILFPMKLPIFEISYMLLPAMILSLPFIIFRVFPGIGFIAGMLLMLFINSSLDLASIITYGVVFWGCVVITDPVTATDKPIVGLLAGFLTGFIPLYFGSSFFALAAAFLIFNGVSFVFGLFPCKKRGWSIKGLKIKAPIVKVEANMEVTDLTIRQTCKACNYEALSSEQILEYIDKNEVFGMGGAGFSTIEKLQTVIKSGANDKYLVVNAMECDPGLIHDKWLMHNRREEIAKGIAILGKLVGFKGIYCITKDIESFSLAEPVEMRQLMDRYPFGAEKIFVEKLLGIDIPIASNPAQYGVLVLNVQTVHAVYEAVCFNKKADTRFITVADMIKGTNKVIKANISDSISTIAEKLIESGGMIFVGGGIMKVHPAMDNEIVGKSTNFIAVGMLPKYKESPQCISCGLCKLCCPMGLNVKKINDLVKERKLLEAQAYNSNSCISCGICSYVCLAGRNLSGQISAKPEHS